MFNRAVILTFLLANLASAADYSLPQRVQVLPVAFVPKDEKPPTDAEQKMFMRHIAQARDRFRELLAGDTFELAKPAVQVVVGQRPLDFYRKPPERGAPDIVSELLATLHLTRFDCPHVFCILLMNSKDSFPEGGGRTINGGVNTGGGMMYIASWELTHNTHFQTTLQHELGHAFGLPHVDVYGYDMKSNASIMSYNPAHHCRGFEPSNNPGVLIPEDLRLLAMNDRVFPKTTFDPKRDVGANYSLSKRIVPLGPMTLPGQPDFYPQVTTTAGEDVHSRVINIVREEIKPSAGPGITYDPGTMWHSKPLPNGKAVLELTFPMPVRLTGLAVHSQHSGIHHEARAVRLEAVDGNSRTEVIDKPITSFDEIVTFPATTSTRWSLTLTAGSSRILVIRGLRFFDGDEEVCPHMIPYAQTVALAQKPQLAEASVAAQATSDKAEVPDMAAQDQARKAIKEQFKVELTKAKKPEARAELAKTFIETAETADDPATRYALLTEALNLAAQGGDLDLALLVAKTLSEKFQVDLLAWKERAAVAMGSATLTLELEAASSLLEKFNALSEEAIAAEEYSVALNVMKAAAETLKKPAYKQFKDDATFQVKQLTSLKEAFDAAKGSREKLESSPDDASANLVWGRFVCFFKQDWDNGLKLLAKANDKIWAPLAQRELSPPQAANDWLQLGDDWLQAGLKEKEPVKFLTAERADRAWQQAIATATQLHKKDMEQKVDQRTAKLFGTSLASTRGDAAGAAIPGSDRFSPLDAFTIEFWMSTTAAKGTLLSKKHSADESSIIVHLDGGAANLSVAMGGGEGGSGGGLPINDGKWHHLAMVKVGNDIVLYVDGTKATSSTLKGPVASRSPWKFGTSHNRTPCSARFGGIRISKSARYENSFTPKKLHAKDKDTLLP